MTAAATLETDTSADCGRPLLERQIGRLDRLADIGMGMAETIDGEVKAAVEAGRPIPERAPIDFARIARTVRLTLMLQAKLIKELEDGDRQAAKEADRAAWSQACDRVTQAFEQKQRVAGIIERIAEQAEPYEAERLTREARERLDRDDIYGHVLSRPASELIAEICRDLGLDPDWPKLAGEAWARAEMAGDNPGRPLTGPRSDGAATTIRLRRHGSSP
jgi:hypothetical protein